jgi:SAM-dependent methyltransferase
MPRIVRMSTRMPLIFRSLLDARPPAVALAQPIADSVNIPQVELAPRIHELPPRYRTLCIADTGDDAAAAAAWLRDNGRTAELTREFQFAADAPECVGRLWTPAPFLEACAPHLRPGRALDLACGAGRDAVWLASLGWRVTAVDVLPDALQRGRDLAGRCAAAIEPIDWRPIDVEHADLDLREAFDLVVVFRFLHRPLLSRLREWTRPGGSLVYETFTTEHHTRHTSPSRDAHLLRPGELLAALRAFDARHYSEDWRDDGAHTARFWGVRTDRPM